MKKIKKLVKRSPKLPSSSQSQQTTDSFRTNEPAVQSSEAPALLSFADGVHVLHDRRDAAIDICFIHGLTGNRESTWTAHGQSAPWPKTLLPPRLETARILTYGYDADIMRKSVAGANRLIDHATNMLTDLTTDRQGCNASTRPLIFIAHSLGGLVCKEAILLSRNNPEAHLKGLFKYVKGIIFMGTPHRGSWMSDWARIPAAALGFVKSNNKSLLTILQTNNEFLESIQVRFAAMVRELRENGRHIELTCFFEELPLHVAGKVVSKDSATFEGYNSISIHGNHSDMVKFGSAEDNGFKRLLGELKRWASSDSVPNGHQKSANPVVGPLLQESNPKFMVPYNENPDFIGRSSILEQVKQQFGYSQPPAAGSPRSRVSLYGLGGVGKTQIALAYAYWLRNTQPEVSVFWVHASNAQRFRQAYTSIAQEYSIAGLDKPNANVLAVVRKWLEKSDRGRWLMVIDNADDTELFFQTRPDGDSTVQEDSSLGRYIPECRHGQVLITTRSKQAGLKLAQGKTPIVVEKLDQGEAEQLVLSMLKGTEVSPQPEEILLLSSRLEYLPLALAQAAAFIQENSTPVGEYIQLLDDSNDSSVDLLSHPFETVGRDLDTPHAITTTWIISFEQIQRQDTLASDVLSFISLLDRQAIPKDFVTHYCNEERPKDSRPIGPAEIIKALGTLKAFCFISEAKDQSLDLHRLVQLVTRKWLHRNNTLRQFAGCALKTVALAYPWARFENWETCSRYLPHAHAVLEHVGTGSRDEDIARGMLQQSIATYYLARGYRLKEAEALGLQVVETWKRVLGEEHPWTLGSMHNLASTFLEQGRWKEAEALLHQVTETRKRLLGEEDLEMLSSISSLASIYSGQGRWKEAEALVHQVTETRKRLLGEEYPDTLSVLGNLAIMYVEQGRLEEAEALELQILEIQKRVLGEEYPDTLITLANLAATYLEQGRLEEAEALELQVLEKRKRVLGDEHPCTLNIMNNLAFTWRRQGHYQKAIALHQRCLHLREKVLGVDHPDTMDNLEILRIWQEDREGTSKIRVSHGVKA